VEIAEGAVADTQAQAAVSTHSACLPAPHMSQSMLKDRRLSRSCGTHIMVLMLKLVSPSGFHLASATDAAAAQSWQLCCAAHAQHAAALHAPMTV